MSNFDDYDLRKSTGRSTRQSGTRPSNSRTSQRRSAGTRLNGERPSYDDELSLDDEIELYDYDLRSESATRRRPASSSSRTSSGRRPQSGHASNHKKTGTRSASDRSRNASAQNRKTADRSSNKSARGTANGAKRPLSKKAKKQKMRRNVIIVEVIIIIILLIIFFLWNKFGKVNWDNISMSDVEVNQLDAETEQILSNYTTLALFGVDNRSSGNLDSGNSDTIIIVSINKDTKEVKMLSVQRDTYLKVAEDTYRKCNYAYNHGGVEQAISMLNTNLDLDIQGYVSVDFYALATIVDDLGGLELEITQSMIDTDNPTTGQNALAGYIAEVENILNYYPSEDEGWKYSDCYFDSPGTYTLNGAQVVGYCRNRYAVNNDYGRAENQRLVIKKIIEKAKKADLATLNKIADDVFPSISTSLKLSEVLSMAASVGDYEIADSSGFPFALKTTTVSKKIGSVVVPCTLESNVIQLHKFLYDQDDYNTTDDVVDVISDYIINQTGLTESSAEITQTSDE